MESVDLREFKELQNQVTLMALDAKAQAQKLELQQKISDDQAEVLHWLTNIIIVMSILLAFGIVGANMPEYNSWGVLLSLMTLFIGSVAILALKKTPLK